MGEGRSRRTKWRHRTGEGPMGHWRAAWSASEWMGEGRWGCTGSARGVEEHSDADEGDEGDEGDSEAEESEEEKRKQKRAQVMVFCLGLSHCS